MGGSQSQELGGFRIFRVTRNSPADRAGLEVFFDFIVEVDGVRMAPDQRVFFQKIQESVDRQLKLLVYNTRLRSLRDVYVIPTHWGGSGLLGATVRFDLFESADSQGVRVLGVLPNSPAAHAGLVPHKDFILGTQDMMFKDPDDLVEVVGMFADRRLPLYIYSADSERIREVEIVPHTNWGGDGYLGADIGTGLLHRIPAPRGVVVRPHEAVLQQHMQRNAQPAQARPAPLQVTQQQQQGPPAHLLQTPQAAQYPGPPPNTPMDPAQQAAQQAYYAALQNPAGAYPATPAGGYPVPGVPPTPVNTPYLPPGPQQQQGPSLSPPPGGAAVPHQTSYPNPAFPFPSREGAPAGGVSGAPSPYPGAYPGGYPGQYGQYPPQGYGYPPQQYAYPPQQAAQQQQNPVLTVTLPAESVQPQQQQQATEQQEGGSKEILITPRANGEEGAGQEGGASGEGGSRPPALEVYRDLQMASPMMSPMALKAPPCTPMNAGDASFQLGPGTPAPPTPGGPTSAGQPSLQPVLPPHPQHTANSLAVQQASEQSAQQQTPIPHPQGPPSEYPPRVNYPYQPNALPSFPPFSAGPGQTRMG